MSNFEDEIRRNMMIELLKFNYTDAELIMRGFEDFLRGPSFFSAPGKAEETYMAANRDREQLVDYDELREEALAQTGIDLDDYDYERIVGEVPLGITRHGRVFNVAHTQLLERTLNGQLAPERAPKVAPRLKPFDGEPVAVIEAAGWATPYGRIYGKDILVVVDPYTRRGTIRRRDDQRCRQIWKRFQDDLARYRKERDRICAEYAEARPQLTSEEFWRDYLGVDR